MSSSLAGKSIVVTRSAEQGAELVGLLRDRGAAVVEVPLIEVADAADAGLALRTALTSVTDFDWIAFTSVNAVRKVLDQVDDPQVLRTNRIAAVGPSTASALATAGVRVDLVASRFDAKTLAADFPDGPGRVLIPAAADARDDLPSGLQQRGWTVHVVEAYRTVKVIPDAQQLTVIRAADAITFTSSSTVTSFVDAGGLRAPPSLVACIGPITAETATEAGLQPDVIATEYTVSGLIRALEQHFAGHGPTALL